MVIFTSAEKILFGILIVNFIAGLIVQDYYTFIGVNPAGDVNSLKNTVQYAVAGLKQSPEKSSISSDCIFVQK